MDQESKIQELESKVAELTALVERLAGAPAAPAPVSAAAAVVDTTEPEAPRSSRRNLLKLAGAAAAGTVAVTATNVAPAAANDPNDLTMGETKSYGGTDATAFEYTNASVPTVFSGIFGVTALTNLFTVRDQQTGLVLGSQSRSAYPAAVGGYTYRTVANGVYGYTNNAGYGVVGWGANTTSIGMLARGTKANLELLSGGTAPAARTDAHTKGEIVNDENGNVWLCVASGTPGTWRKLAGPATAGTFHALAPGRVYDSRVAQPLQGAISGGQNRTISVKDKRATDTGAVTLADFVPAGATAVAANITIQTQSGSGFLTVNPGGSTAAESSTINWSAAGQLLANGVTLTLNGNRELTVVCGGGGSTDFIVDISGYYL